MDESIAICGSILKSPQVDGGVDCGRAFDFFGSSLSCCLGVTETEEQQPLGPSGDCEVTSGVVQLPILFDGL